MQIYCPKCDTGYEIDESLIPDNGKKLRCSQCGEIFTARRSDLKAAPHKEERTADIKEADTSDSEDKPETQIQEENQPEIIESSKEDNAAGENGELNDIFKRLSQQTEDLFKAENEMPGYKKFFTKAKQLTGLNNRQNRYILASVIGILVLLTLYSFRFDVVREMPFMNVVYRMAGIKATIPGEGLEFQNIVWRDFEEDYVRQLEIKGFVVNPSAKDIELPVIHMEMLDKEARLLQSLNQEPMVKKLKAGSRVAISVIIKKPSPITKYVYLTFIDKD